MNNEVYSNMTREITADKLIEKYPKLLASKDNYMVVLFNKYKSGTIVHLINEPATEDICTLGDYSANWCMEDFEPLNGHVVLADKFPY